MPNRTRLPTRWLTALACACAIPAGGLDAQQDAGPLEPGLHVTVRERRYELALAELWQVRDSLAVIRLDPRKDIPIQGLTDYTIMPRWRYEVLRGHCVVSTVEVRVDVTVTLPEWTGVDSASMAERSGWRSILARYTEHEYAHRDAVIAAAGALLQDVRLARARRCTALDRSVRRLIEEANERLEDVHAELDGRQRGGSGHGSGPTEG